MALLEAGPKRVLYTSSNQRSQLRYFCLKLRIFLKWASSSSLLDITAEVVRAIYERQIGGELECFLLFAVAAIEPRQAAATFKQSHLCTRKKMANSGREFAKQKIFIFRAQRPSEPGLQYTSCLIFPIVQFWPFLHSANLFRDDKYSNLFILYSSFSLHIWMEV